MLFIATIKLDSTMDQFLKFYGFKEYNLFGNLFKLAETDIYSCVDIQELRPLLDLDDIEVILEGTEINLGILNANS